MTNNENLSNKAPFPTQPDGMPYSKDDYLALSKEYQAERDKIARSKNTSGCLFVIIGVIAAGLAFPIMFTVSSALGIVFLIAGAICLIAGGLAKPQGDKRINELQEKYYSEYINSINNQS